MHISDLKYVVTIPTEFTIFSRGNPNENKTTVEGESLNYISVIRLHIRMWLYYLGLISYLSRQCDYSFPNTNVTNIR